MIDVVIGAFIGALAGALWVSHQCTKRDIKNEERIATVEIVIEAINKGLQASLICQGDIIKLVTKPHVRRRKTSKSNK